MTGTNVYRCRDCGNDVEADALHDHAMDHGGQAGFRLVARRDGGS